MSTSAATATNAYTITGNAGSQTPTIYVSRDEAGAIQEHEQTQDERLEEKIPPRGEYALEIVAFAQPFQMPIPDQFRKPDGPTESTNTRIKLEFLDGKGKGHKTSILATWVIGPRSNLGRLWRIATGEEPQGGEYDVTRLLGCKFRALLQPSESTDVDGNPRGTRIVWESVVALDAPASDEDDGLWK